VQRPSRASKWHDALSHQRPHLRRRFAVRETRWHAELPHIIWGLRTQVSSVTGYSPFFLVYGSEAVLPSDVAFCAPRIQHYEEGTAEEMCKVDLDSIEEHRVAALM
jgi:hypothetical protein